MIKMFIGFFYQNSSILCVKKEDFQSEKNRIYSETFIIDIDKNNNIIGMEFHDISTFSYDASNNHLEIVINAMEYADFGIQGMNNYHCDDICFWYSEKHDLLACSVIVKDLHIL